jgi:hypothetical protein
MYISPQLPYRFFSKYSRLITPTISGYFTDSGEICQIIAIMCSVPSFAQCFSCHLLHDSSFCLSYLALITKQINQAAKAVVLLSFSSQQFCFSFLVKYHQITMLLGGNLLWL